MPDVLLVDTNVFLRHVLQDIPDHAVRSTRLLERAQSGDVVLFAPSTVFFELSHYMHRTLKLPRAPVAASLLDILSNPGVAVDHPDAIRNALTLWARQGPLSFPDCFHLALARELGMDKVCTFDRKMDRYPGVERVEP